jgi:hypothetical protein
MGNKTIIIRDGQGAMLTCTTLEPVERRSENMDLQDFVHSLFLHQSYKDGVEDNRSRNDFSYQKRLRH